MSCGPNARTFHILLVEDNAADIYLFRQALKAAGLNFELTVIEDGADGLAFARREGEYAANSAPDLAVLDLNLPKGGGASVLEAMRQSKDLERVPVFIMTSSAGPREQARARELGVERFITKPLDLEEFLKIGHVVKEVLLKSTAGPEVAGSSSHTTAE
jgi:two-component system, chemotaxis family, response regulator Rcp1